MVEHKCGDCGKVFNQKCNYVTHKNKKISCKKEDLVLTTFKQVSGEFLTVEHFNKCLQDLVCAYCCKKFYGDQKSIIRHVKTSCKAFLEAKQSACDVPDDSGNNKIVLKDFVLDKWWDKHCPFDTLDGVSSKFFVKCIKTYEHNSISVLANEYYIQNKDLSQRNVYVRKSDGLGVYYNGGEWHEIDATTLIFEICNTISLYITRMGSRNKLSEEYIKKLDTGGDIRKYMDCQPGSKIFKDTLEFFLRSDYNKE
jgi:uncharacterized C2H2 Zn-finger protein